MCEFQAVGEIVLPEDEFRKTSGAYGLRLTLESRQSRGEIRVAWNAAQNRSVRRISMKRTLFVLLIAGVALVAGSRVQAHHSFAATYFEDQTTSIEGNLVQFLFRNPHSFVHVEAPDKDGQMQRWAVEWGAGGQLNRQGVTRETLHPGDHVVVTGNPGRNPADHRLRMKTITRPSDGWKWGGTFD
jgi:hypothetical protein